MSEKVSECRKRSSRASQWAIRLLWFILVGIPLVLMTHGSLTTRKAGRLSGESVSIETLSEQFAAEELEKLGLSYNSPVKVLKMPGGKSKKLHGRFLHITDIHPDPLYKTGSSIDRVCHRGKPDNSKDEATRFGVAMAGCDSSMDLMEYTLKWVEDNLRDKIDFVIWTGDNIRHDNDRNEPRTESQIFELNAKMAKKFQDIFRNPNSLNPRDFDVDVIPSLGNNDVFPHNLFSLGPTLQTREIYNMWANFIPQEQQRTFARDTSFFVEVIPNKLAVLSINTLYLYKANPLVDNCDSKKEPGYQLLLWLGYVLEELRSRNMKVWLTGHVPPLAKNYDQGCYDKFTLWTNEYRDVIIGGLYGHMNMDHFVPVDAKRSWKAIKSSTSKAKNKATIWDEQDDDDFEDDTVLESAVEASDARIMGAKPVNKGYYMDSVREGIYQKIASRVEKAAVNKKKKQDKSKKKHKKKKKHPKDKGVERYSIVNVAGSVIPTFNPAFRVWEYNTTGLEASYEQSEAAQPWGSFFQDLDARIENEVTQGATSKAQGILADILRGNKGKKVDKTIPPRMPKDLKPGPGYTPQLFSPTRFVQYYADLASIDKAYKKALEEGKSEAESAETAFKYEVEYCSDSEPYAMKSLLTQDYIDLAVKLASDNTVWNKYVERAFCSSGYTDE